MKPILWKAGLVVACLSIAFIMGWIVGNQQAVKLAQQYYETLFNEEQQRHNDRIKQLTAQADKQAAEFQAKLAKMAKQDHIKAIAEKATTAKVYQDCKLDACGVCLAKAAAEDTDASLCGC